MAIEWSLRDEDLDDEEAVIEALKGGYEPFAIYKGKLWLKVQFFNEDSEPKSSTRPENRNWMGNEPDEADDAEED